MKKYIVNWVYNSINREDNLLDHLEYFKSIESNSSKFRNKIKLFLEKREEREIILLEVTDIEDINYTNI